MLRKLARPRVARRRAGGRQLCRCKGSFHPQLPADSMTFSGEGVIAIVNRLGGQQAPLKFLAFLSDVSRVRATSRPVSNSVMRLLSCR